MNKLSRVITLIALLPLADCGHNIYIVNQKTGASTQSRIVTVIGQAGGDVDLNLDGKVYHGRWGYMKDGGSSGFGSAYATTGAQSATASGSFSSIPASGGGTILASAPDGSILRCRFSYNDWSASGLGACQNNRGGTYDLQIN